MKNFLGCHWFPHVPLPHHVSLKGSRILQLLPSFNVPYFYIACVWKCKDDTLQWRHKGRGGVSNHQHQDCLPNRVFRCRSKKTSKRRVIGLCEGNSSVAGELPAQRASDAENASIWWRHHVGRSPMRLWTQKCTPTSSHHDEGKVGRGGVFTYNYLLNQHQL